MSQTERPALVRTTIHADGRDEVVTADADGLLDAIATVPALRDLLVGTVSSYQVDIDAIQPEALVSLLTVVGDDAENAESWPEDVAEAFHRL